MGAMVGAVVGISIVAFIKFADKLGLVGEKIQVAGILNAFIGFTSCLVVGYLVSLATGGGTGQGEELSVHGGRTEG